MTTVQGPGDHQGDENSTEPDSGVWNTEGFPKENVLKIYLDRIKRIFSR